MRGFELKYMSPEVADSISNMLEEFATPENKLTPDKLLEKIIQQLPIDKMDRTTIRERVEGLYFASELLWNKLLDSKKFSREEAVKKAKLKPLSFYHYQTGSREPSGNVMTRDDYYNDPATAMAKLKDDIVGLALVVPEIVD